MIELLVVIVIIGITCRNDYDFYIIIVTKGNIAKGKIFEESVPKIIFSVGMVSRWKLDETSGTVAVDSWGRQEWNLYQQ